MATVRKIYQLALAKIMETPGSDLDYENFSPLLLDSLLAEALPYENAARQARGEQPLRHAPEIDKIDDTEIDWEDGITRSALPWGLAAALLFDDENRKAECVMFRNEFVSALETAAPAVLGYGESEGEADA